jgi:hypothetical protein
VGCNHRRRRLRQRADRAKQMNEKTVRGSRGQRGCQRRRLQFFPLRGWRGEASPSCRQRQSILPRFDLVERRGVECRRFNQARL